MFDDLPPPPPAAARLPNPPAKLGLFERLRVHFIRYTRALTEGERRLAVSVFGDALDLDKVQLKTAWWVMRGYAVAPNGHIYFHPSDWRDDFSGERLVLRAWLIHELTHVWQAQQGRAVFWRALVNRRYHYVLDGKRFTSFGIEQQARMVEDYYLRREQGLDITAWQTSVPFHGVDARADGSETLT